MGFTELARAVRADQNTDGGTDAARAPAGEAVAATSTQSAAPEVVAVAEPPVRPEARIPEAAEAPVAAPAAEAAVAAAEDRPSESPVAAETEANPEQKRGFFASLFGRSDEPKSDSTDNADAEPKSQEKSEPRLAAKPAEQPVAQPVKLTSFSFESSAPVEKKIIIDSSSVASAYTANALPGVRASSELFDIVRKSGGSDDSDVDLYEEEGSYQVASATGLARLAPHGLLRQRPDVNTSCFKPGLVRILKTIERHYGKPVLVTSGYRSPAHNRRVRGARKSAHMDCAAADIQVAGVSRWELARFARSLPGRGGVGTYCHTASVHVDVGAERDWNWRCRR